VTDWRAWADSPQVEDIASHGNQWRLAGAAWEAATAAERSRLIALMRQALAESEASANAMSKQGFDGIHPGNPFYSVAARIREMIEAAAEPLEEETT
jgi:uncharacterized protein (DUF2237 family)